MQYASLPIDVTNSRPETIFKMGVVSAKVGMVTQTCRVDVHFKEVWLDDEDN